MPNNCINMKETQEEGAHGFFKNNPLIQLCLVDKYVRVDLIKDCCFEGFVHSFDPISNSIILSIPQDSGFNTTVIPGQAIVNVAEHPMPSNKAPPTRLSQSTAPEEVLPKKTKLMEWLKSNLLPVTEENDIIIFGNVSILPPYGVMDICTDSPMVAMQTRKLIENMPKDNMR